MIPWGPSAAAFRSPAMRTTRGSDAVASGDVPTVWEGKGVPTMDRWDAKRATLVQLFAQPGRWSHTMRLTMAILLAGISLASTGFGVSAVVNTVQFNLAPERQVRPLFHRRRHPFRRRHRHAAPGHDTLRIVLSNFKPDLAFDLFTVQPVPCSPTAPRHVFTSFGLAWYQSDIQVDGAGHAA